MTLTVATPIPDLVAVEGSTFISTVRSLVEISGYSRHGTPREDLQ